MPPSRRRNFPIAAAAAADTETVPRAGPRRRGIPAPTAARPDRPPLAAFTTDDAIRARPPPNPPRRPVKRIPPPPPAPLTACPATAGRRLYSRLPPPHSAAPQSGMIRAGAGGPLPRRTAPRRRNPPALSAA